MKKVVVVIAALFAVMVLTSCGAASTTSAEGTATPAAGTTAAGASAAATITPDMQLPVPRAFEVSAENTPQFFQDALKQKKPLLVMFYAEDGVSQQAMEAVETAYNNDKYAGVVDFLLLKQGDSDEITELARNFSVGYIPYTTVIDRNGQIIFEQTGFLDTKVLEQYLYIATNK